MSNLIILGASTRAAAMSALRAGWTPWCADLFADADLQRIASVRKIADDAYPDALLDAIGDSPDGPVMYTGALENRPDLIARLDRQILGNTAQVLRAVRSPLRWAECMRAHGLPCPRISEAAAAEGRWLSKPRRSAAGFGIRDYNGGPFNGKSHFLQERIDGTPVSAVFVGIDGDARLCGVTEQLIGTLWLNAQGFHYAGSIGPLNVDPAPWHAIGAALASTFHLTGLFGVDAVMRDGVPWPVEINPRYTASVEVIERSQKVALLSACGLALGSHPAIAKPQTATVGKAIVYARRTFAFPTDGPWLDSLNETNLDNIEYADIPHAGEVIEEGQPMLTVFASASSVEDCRRSLQEKVQALDRGL